MLGLESNEKIGSRPFFRHTNNGFALLKKLVVPRGFG
jgi:hypothetical protein